MNKINKAYKKYLRSEKIHNFFNKISLKTFNNTEKAIENIYNVSLHQKELTQEASDLLNKKGYLEEMFPVQGNPVQSSLSNLRMLEEQSQIHRERYIKSLVMVDEASRAVQVELNKVNTINADIQDYLDSTKRTKYVEEVEVDEDEE